MLHVAQEVGISALCWPATGCPGEGCADLLEAAPKEGDSWVCAGSTPGLRGPGRHPTASSPACSNTCYNWNYILSVVWLLSLYILFVKLALTVVCSELHAGWSSVLWSVPCVMASSTVVRLSGSSSFLLLRIVLLWRCQCLPFREHFCWYAWE